MLCCVVMRDTKEYIVRTALPLFMEKSYKAVTLKDIIRETGLSNGAFYHYFRNKEELFKEVVALHLFRLARRIYEYAPKSSLWDFMQDTLGELQKVQTELEKFVALGGRINFLSFMFEAFRQFPEAQKEVREMQKLEFALWVEVIDIAKAKGEIRDELPTELIARMFMYIPDGIYMDFLVDLNQEKYKIGTKRLWEGIYKMLKA